MSIFNKFLYYNCKIVFISCTYLKRLFVVPTDVSTLITCNYCFAIRITGTGTRGFLSKSVILLELLEMVEGDIKFIKLFI